MSNATAPENFNSQFKNYLLNDLTYPIIYETLYYDENKYLMEENQIIESIYIIESGVVVEKKRQIISSFLGREESIGLEGILQVKVGATTSVMTLTKTIVYRVSIQSIQEKMLERPIGYKILNELLVHQITALTNRLTDTDTNHDKTLHVLERLAFLYGQEKNDAIYIKKFFTKKMIANYLQVSYGTILSSCRSLVAEGILHDELHGMILYPANTSR